MKRALPIILAVLLAVIAAGLVFLYTRGAEQRALDEQQPVNVLVSTAVIPQGMPLADAVSGGLAQQTQVPSTMVPVGAITALTPENSSLLALREIAAGEILQNLYEDARHPQAAAVRAWLAEAPVHEELPACQVGLYRLFQGPIATTLDNRREPFLAVAPETPGKNVYPPGITAAEVEAFLAAHPEEREAILGERTAVRRATTAALARDLAALGRHPVGDPRGPAAGTGPR